MCIPLSLLYLENNSCVLNVLTDFFPAVLPQAARQNNRNNTITPDKYFFTNFFIKTFITYVTDRKMDLAKEMLVNTDIPVLNIALDLAYNEANYFSKAFKKKTGLTPSEYREKYRNRKEEENETV